MGRVKSLPREFLQRHYSGCYSHYHKDEKILKIQKQRNGYYTIDLHKDKTLKRVLIHRLVAQHFIENTYRSTAEASRKTGIQQVNIAKCARKERKHAGGYRWEYTKQK